MSFFKDKYKTFWQAARNKEISVKQFLQERCNCQISMLGYGAGTDKYLVGSPPEQGIPDLKVDDTNIRVEVTGTNCEKVKVNDPLWIRPDKRSYAKRHPELDVWVVHVMPNYFIRCVHLDEECISSGEWACRRVVIRGTEEVYDELPSSSKHVLPITYLIHAIKTRARERW